MNCISAEEKVGDYGVTVSRGLTKDGKDQYQICIAQKKSGLGQINLSMMVFSHEEWNDIRAAILDLKESIGAHVLTSADNK